MTTKEIANATGKTERTVRNWVTKATKVSSVIEEKSSVSSPMNPADYDLDETCIIIANGLGANAASVYRMNAEQNVAPAITSNIDEQFKLALIGISTMVQNLNSRMDKVEYQQHQRAALLPAPQKDARSELTQLVNKHAHQNHGNDHRAAWKELYTEIYYRLHINVRKRAKNEGVKGVDILAREGLLETACAIVGELLGGDV